jgi:hypothetical protein
VKLVTRRPAIVKFVTVKFVTVKFVTVKFVTVKFVTVKFVTGRPAIVKYGLWCSGLVYPVGLLTFFHQAILYLG